MDINLAENVTLTDAVEQANTHISAATLTEILCVLAIPLLSLLLGITINRAIDKRPQTTLTLRIIDFSGPLLSPFLAVILSLLGKHFLPQLGTPVLLMPFVVKLAVAWFAIQLVILMSNRKSAGWMIACIIIPITLLHLFNLWDATIDTLTALSFEVGSTKLNVYMILKAIAIIYGLQWAASFAVRLTDSRLQRIRTMRAGNRVLIVKIFQILLYCFAFLIGMQMLGISLAALSVFGGALGVGLGFGLQKIASNFISGIILLFEKSIEPGDLIELSDGTTGNVRQTNARFTLMETQDGRDILIPNEEFITQRVISWTHSNKRARVQIAISVGYETDLDLAKKLMIEAAMQHPKRSKTREPLCVLNNFGDSGVELYLYFWIADVNDGRAEPKSDVMLAIFKAFKANNISIPYPQRELRVTNLTPTTPDEHA